jgi:putative ABC transport system permease protein
MIKHNLLLIFRNFKRFKSTFLINLVGLSTGLACTLIIYLWVNDELKFDKFHKNDQQLYLVMANFHNSGNVVTTRATPGLLGVALE